MMTLIESHRAWLLSLLVIGSLLLLVPTIGAPLIFASGVLATGAALMLVRPQVAVFAAIFLLYSNIAVVSQRLLPYPQLLAAVVVLPLTIPVIYSWIVHRERLKGDAVFLLMLLFLIAQLISSFAAKDYTIATERILTFSTEGILLYFLVRNAVRSRRSLMNAIGAALLAGALLGALSLYQAVTHAYDQQFGGLAQRQLKRELEQQQPGAAATAVRLSGVRLAERAAGPVGDPNRFAQILLVLLPLATYRFWNTRSLSRKTIALLAFGMLLCGVLLSYSRGAFLTIALLVFLLVLAGSIRLLHVLIAAFLLALAIPFVAPSYYQRIQTLVGAQGLVAGDAGVDTDRVLKGRATEMLAALHVLIDHPIIGVGPGQYMPFYSEQYQLDPDTALLQVARERRAHDLYLEIGAETGLPGLVLFVSMPLLLLGRLWRARRKYLWSQPELANLAMAFCFSIIAYLGTGIFLHLAFERYYWLLLALAAAALPIMSEQREDFIGEWCTRTSARGNGNRPRPRAFRRPFVNRLGPRSSRRFSPESERSPMIREFDPNQGVA